LNFDGWVTFAPLGQKVDEPITFWKNVHFDDAGLDGAPHFASQIVSSKVLGAAYLACTTNRACDNVL
jgi:hypothetical protein